MSKRTFGVLFACFLTVLTAYAIRYSYGILLPEMLPSLAITKAQAGIIFSSYFVAYTLLSPVLGTLADKYDIRWLLTFFVGLMGIGTILMAFPTSQLQACMFFTLAGIGCAACWAPTMALARRWTSSGRKGMTLALVDLGSALGIIISSAVVPLVVVANDWRTGWVSVGALGILASLLNLVLIRSYPKTTDQQATQSIKDNKISVRKLLGDRTFWLIGLAYLFTGFSIIIPFTFLSTYAVQHLTFSYELATRLVVVIGAAAVLGKLVLGPVSDRIGAGRMGVMMLCAVLIAAGALGMGYGRGWVLYLAIAVFGIGYGGVWSMYAACASDLFPKEWAGGIIGLWTFYLGVGSMFAPFIAGWIADFSGTLQWAFLLSAAAGFISLILLIPLRNTTCKISINSKNPKI